MGKLLWTLLSSKLSVK